MNKYIIILMAFIGLVSCRKDSISGNIDVEFEVENTDVFTGDEVKFNSLVSGIVAQYDWIFEGGTPETSPLSSPTVQWFDAGNYTVTLTVSNKNDTATVTKKKIITVDYSRSISADFKVDRTTATNIEYIQFTNLSTGYPTSFLWTFKSDGGIVVTSTDQNPRLKLDPGIYTVTLKAYNPITSDIVTKPAIIHVIDKDSVSAGFTKDRTVILEDGTVKFYDNSLGTVEQWLWEFEGGTPSSSTEANPIITYANEGEWNVKLTVKNSINTSSITEPVCVKVVSKKNIVFFLPMDGDIKDYSANGYNASFYTIGSAACTFVNGHNAFSDQAVSMPGGNKGKCSVIQLPADNWQSVFPRGSDMTLSMWVKTATLGIGQAGFFAQGSCPGVLTEGYNQIWVRMQSNGVIRMLVESYQGASNDIQVDNKWLDDAWHHYAFVYKSTPSGKKDSYMYIDGELVGSALGRPEKAIDTTPFFLGTNMRLTSGTWAPESCLAGSLDDVFLYARALDETEIVKLSKY